MPRILAALFLVLFLGSIIGLPLLFWYVKRSAPKQEPLSSRETLVFTLVRPMQLLIWFVITLLIAFMILVLFTSTDPQGRAVALLIPLGVRIAILVAIPRSVILDETGIRQRRLLLPDRQTAWSELTTVSRDRHTGRIFLSSINGKIAAVFSPQLIGLRRFEQEVRIRAKHAVFEYE
jgi:uncharacterized Tic20 family protein